MSHSREREEKVCLNCGTAVHGRFCHICGQENIEPKESFWHLVTHFAYDITHFDGKFFSTLKYLLFRPGHLSREYLLGRRASYLHPIRMYVFTSAFFFLVFFGLHKDDEVGTIKITEKPAAAIIEDLEKKRQSLQDDLKDSLPELARTPIRKSLELVESDIALLQKDSTAKNNLQSTGNNFSVFSFSSNEQHYRSAQQYDSLQASLPGKDRDNFIERRFARQNLHLREKYHNDGKAIWTAILSKFRHLFPQMMFVSLPLFALLLQLLYIRRRSFYYVNHVVYSIHLYCAIFMIILIGILANLLVTPLGYHISDWTNFLFGLAAFYYWYKSMRNFYEQRRGRTVMKYLLLMFLSLFLISFIFTIFFLFSAMAI